MPILYLLLISMLSACANNTAQLPVTVSNKEDNASINPYSTIAAVPLPPGFTRLQADSSSYTAWLRKLPLKKNKTVYLFNGNPKTNQTAQFAVINISTGNKDLQQCADAVMRLRAEYLYAQKRFGAIDFIDNNYTHYRLSTNADRDMFSQYLEKVFSYCGTASLVRQLLAVNDFASVTAGDVLIKGGSPGHAMQVMDIAVNKEGKRIDLLAQSYMPAQDMHVVINPANSKLSPWYEANDEPVIETPEWTFRQSNLKKWPAE